ncbi:MAG TPA: winged helix-turn-helix domain-containing protein [Bryobacteraceae bacterium]|nr:winged helix-turn-helix domain-containing protein [Bryobacteraceae bacterium]
MLLPFATVRRGGGPGHRQRLETGWFFLGVQAGEGIDVPELKAYNSGSMPGISGRVSFGEFELDLEAGKLCKSGRTLKLRPQPMRVLCLLVSHAGRPVSREEIRRTLWGESTFVDYDVGVDSCVNRIRSALRDNAQAPHYVETLPRQGYRFIAPVKRQRAFAEPTLAVLPFANLNGDPARDYFADGVTDALITELARFPAVRVISRQSVLHLKGSSRKLDEIARDLGVDGLVEGAALHEGNRVRLTAQLILTEPERHVWAQSYECDMSAVLSTQREAARAVATCVARAMRPDAAVVPAPAGAGPAVHPAPEIVEAYLKVRFECDKMSAEGIGKALQYCREITLNAPNFAPGLAEHARVLFCVGFWGHAPTVEVYPAVKQLALQALAIDDSVGVAHVALAWMNLLLDWDLPAAMREIQRAIELSPSDTDAHLFYGTLLCFVGRHSESITKVEYALNLNPVSLLPNQYAGWMYSHMGQHARAEAQARRTIELFPDSLQPYFVLGWSQWYQSRAEEAIAVLEKALSHSREALSLAYLGHVYGRLGRTDDARRLLQELDQLRNRGQAPPIAFATIHAGLGEIDAAFDWLETAYRLRDGYLFWLPGAPGLDPLRSDPRFADLIRRTGVVPP